MMFTILWIYLFNMYSIIHLVVQFIQKRCYYRSDTNRRADWARNNPPPRALRLMCRYCLSEGDMPKDQ